MLLKHLHRIVLHAAVLIASAVATEPDASFTYVYADDATGNWKFGYAVALSGDTLLSSSPEDDSVVRDGGSAYVMVWDGSTWAQQQKLVIPNISEKLVPGKQIALDLDTAVIGVPNQSPGGCVYVYYRTGTTWALEATLISDDVSEGDLFGTDVGVSGDTIIAGAPAAASDGVSGTGAAYVFVRSGSVWTQEAKLAPGTLDFNDNFGQSVDIEGDTVVIGAPYSNSGNTLDSGAIWIFTRSGTTWNSGTELHANTPIVSEVLGEDVAVNGDSVIGGAPYRSQYGAAYIFSRDPTTDIWSQEVRLQSVDGQKKDYFGISVALEGNVALIGAYQDSSAGTYSGAAYTFWRHVYGQWAQTQRVWQPLTDSYTNGDRDYVGKVVTIDNGICVLSAEGFKGAGHKAGAALVFNADIRETWTTTLTTTTSITHTSITTATSSTSTTHTTTTGTSTTDTTTTQTTTTQTTTSMTSTTETTTTTVSSTTLTSSTSSKTSSTSSSTITTTTETTTSTVTTASETSTTSSSSTRTTSSISSTSSVTTTTETSTSTVTTTTETTTSMTSTTSSSTSTVSTTSETSTTSTTSSTMTTTSETSTTMTSTSTTSSTITTTSVTSTSTTSTASTTTVTSTSTVTTTTQTSTSTSSSTTTSSSSTSSTTTSTSTSTVSTTSETSTTSTTVTSTSTVTTTSETSTTSSTSSMTSTTVTSTSTSSTVTTTTETSSTTSSTMTTSTSSTTTVTTTSETSTSTSTVTTTTITITSSSTTTSTVTTTSLTSTSSITTTTATTTTVTSTTATTTTITSTSTVTTTTGTSTTTTVTGIRAKTMQELQAQIDEVEEAAIQDLFASGQDEIEAPGVINAGKAIAAKTTNSRMDFSIAYDDDVTIEVSVPRIVINDLRAGYIVIVALPERVMAAISDRRAPILGDMLSITCYNADGVKLEARSLRRPITMKLPSLDLNVSACGWYENATDSWSNYRLRTLDPDEDGYLKCATYHLTLFANIAAPDWRVWYEETAGDVHWLLYPASLFFLVLVTFYILLLVNRRSRHQGEWQIEYIENSAVKAIEKQAWSEDVKRLSREESFREGWDEKMVRYCACQVMAYRCRVCDTDCARFLEAHKNRDPLELGIPAKSHHPAFNHFWNSRWPHRTWVLFLAFQPILRIRRLTTKGVFWVCADFLAVPFVSFATTSALVVCLLWGVFGTIDSQADVDPIVLGISVFLGVTSFVLAAALVRMAQAATGSKIDSRFMRACVVLGLGCCLASPFFLLANMSSRAGLYWLVAAFTVFLCRNVAVPMLKALYYAFHAGRTYRADRDRVQATYRNLYALKAESGEPPVHVWDCSHHTDSGKLKEQECIKDFSSIFMTWGLGARVDSDRPLSPDSDEEGDFTPVMCTNPATLHKIISLHNTTDGSFPAHVQSSRPASQPELEPDVVVGLNSHAPRTPKSKESSRQSVTSNTPKANLGASQNIMDGNGNPDEAQSISLTEDWARPADSSAHLGASQIALDWKPGASADLQSFQAGGRAVTAGSARTPAADGGSSRNHTAGNNSARGLGATSSSPLAAAPHGAGFGSRPISPLAEPNACVKKDSVHSLNTEVLESGRNTPAVADAEEPGEEPEDDENFDPTEVVLNEHASSRPSRSGSRSGSPASSRGSMFSLPDADDDYPEGKHQNSGTATGLWQEFAHHR